MGPCLEVAGRRGRAYVRSSKSAATGLTGLDVCLWGRFSPVVLETWPPLRALQKVPPLICYCRTNPLNSDFDTFPRDTVSDKYSYFARLRLFKRERADTSFSTSSNTTH